MEESPADDPKNHSRASARSAEKLNGDPRPTKSEGGGDEKVSRPHRKTGNCDYDPSAVDTSDEVIRFISSLEP
jgi:hypothetical protein